MGAVSSTEQSPSDPIAEGTSFREYFLLNDQPLVQVEDDPLGMADIAAGIAAVLVASIKSSPFVLAVDAGWGMGKSTLLHQVENHLPDNPSSALTHGLQKTRMPLKD